MVEEDLKELDRIIDVLEERVDGQFSAEVGPNAPVVVGGGGMRSGDSETDGVFSSMEVSQEVIASGGVQRRQERCWG